MSGNLAHPDRTERERRLFLPDLPEILRKKERWRGGQNESQMREEKRSGRLVSAAETSKELAEWCRLQQKNLSMLGLLKRKECPQCHRESS